MVVKGLTTPLLRWLRVLVCLCRCVGLLRSLLLDWYLVLKNWGKYLRYFAASPFPLQGKPTQAQDVARRISGAVAGEVFAQVNTYPVPITNSSPSHYIICHLPLVFLSPTSPLPFYSPSLSILPLFLSLPLFARLLFVCLCVNLLARHDGSR